MTFSSACSPTPTPSATATPTASPPLTPIVPCVGDCDANGAVTVNELVLGVNITLDARDLADCPPFDADGSATVQINELVQGVNNALRGCF